jgi:hypothetical protein
MPTAVVVSTRRGGCTDTKTRDIINQFDDAVEDSWSPGTGSVSGERQLIPSDILAVDKVVGPAPTQENAVVRNQLEGVDDDSWSPDVAVGRDTESLSQDSHSKKKRQRKHYHQKNKENQQSFCCAVCGRHDFETETGGLRHQSECDGQYNSKGPWKCAICGRDKFSTSQAFSGHWRCCNKGDHITQSDLCLQPEVLSDEFAKLSDFNRLILGSMEFFEASESDVIKQMVGNGRRSIEFGNVGIRCKSCVQVGVLTVGSISYTNDLKTMPHNLYVMTKRHLLGNCPNVIPSLRSDLKRSKKCSTSQSMKKGAVGLPTYLRLLNTCYELTDDGKANGVRRRKLSSSWEAEKPSDILMNVVEL